MMHVPAEDIAPSFCCRIMSLPQSEFEHLEGIKHILKVLKLLLQKVYHLEQIDVDLYHLHPKLRSPLSLMQSY